jgi:hypothetical protein
MKTFSKEQIYGYIKEFEMSDNSQYMQEHPENYNCSFSKRKLLEIKVLIDRWSNITTDVILHSSHREMVIESLGADLSIYDLSNRTLSLTYEKAKKILGDKLPFNNVDEMAKFMKEYKPISSSPGYYIWGCEIHFSDNIPINAGIALGGLVNNDSDKDSNSIVVFPM